MSAYPKSILSIVASVGGLAVFLVLASLFMVSQPIGPTLSRYFYRVKHIDNSDSISLFYGSPSDGDIAKNLTKPNLHSNDFLVSSHPNDKTFADPIYHGGDDSKSYVKSDVQIVEIDESQDPTSQNTYKKSVLGQDVSLSGHSDNNTTVSKSEVVVDQPRGMPSASNEGKVDNVSLSSNETVKVPQLSTEVLSYVSPVQGNISKTDSGHSGSTCTS